MTLRFSPRLGFSPVNRALANSKAAPAALDGPSHSSAVTGSTRSTRTLGSSGPPGNQRSSVFFQIHDPRHHSRRCGYIRLSRRVARNNDRCKDRAKASPRPMLSAHCPTQRPGARNVDVARKLKLPLSAKPSRFRCSPNLKGASHGMAKRPRAYQPLARPRRRAPQPSSRWSVSAQSLNCRVRSRPALISMKDCATFGGSSGESRFREVCHD